MARRIVLSLVVIGLAISLAATARLGVVVASTPSSLWLVEYPRLVDFSVPVSPSVEVRAEAVSRYVSDVELFHGRIDDCASVALHASADRDKGPGEQIRRCLAAIDDALQANPASGELWLFKASVLMLSSEFGQPMQDALSHSYLTTPREGWIASERVVLGLRLYPLLPPSLQHNVLSDLGIVLSNATLASPLVETYPRDLALRRAAAGALRMLPTDQLNTFVSLVKSGDAYIGSR